MDRKVWDFLNARIFVMLLAFFPGENKPIKVLCSKETKCSNTVKKKELNLYLGQLNFTREVAFFFLPSAPRAALRYI
jgi:hypothetical protein